MHVYPKLLIVLTLLANIFLNFCWHFRIFFGCRAIVILSVCLSVTTRF